MSDIWEFGGDAGATTPLDAPGRFPWPPSEGDALLGAFGQTWKAATFEPARFFALTPRDGGTGAPLLYYLAIGILVAGATLFWSTVGQLGGAATEEALAVEMGLGALPPLARFLLSPLLLLFALGLSAGVVHILLLLVGGARHGFGTTTRVFCFAYSPMIFGVIPVLGGWVGTLWMLVLAVIGLREAHETDGWRAALAVLLPFVVLVGMMTLMALIVLSAGAALFPA